ncbi:hypothetical protein ACTJIJ_19080 [Niabella sp. 22666]|uniref:hypothetical protein n=1 Tax=Niabella sp. 22666 TaxID=3453954 RepID=UPI003F831D11
MIKPVLHNSIAVKKAIGILFLFVMLFSYGAQALHHHYEAPQNHTSDRQLTFVKGNSNLHCDLCDQILHQSSFDLAVSIPEISSRIPGIPAHGGRYYIGFYKFTLQGFSNKGPPFTLVA